MIRDRLARMLRDFDFAVAGKWLALSALVGVVAGLGAMVFQFALQFLRELCLGSLAGLDLGYPRGEPPDFDFPIGSYVPWLVVALPALGGLLSGVLVFRLAPEAEGHGTDSAIEAFHRKQGRIRGRVPIVKLIASAITLSTGGSGGREGPIAQIGAGFGSVLATRLGLTARDRRWLLAAGVGAGVGSIFRAPLAGALFSAEVLYSSSDVETEALLPSTVASIVAYSVYASRFGWGHMFAGAGDYGFDSPFELGPYLVLAIVLSLAALLYVQAFYGLKRLFTKLPIPRELKPMLGGALTGLVALALISGFGRSRDVGDVLSSGYGIIQAVLDTDAAGVSLVVLLLVGFGKILTTSLSIGSGGSGGVFGPSMVIGATLGTAVGKLFHMASPALVPHPATFAIVGMAAFFAAAANTPLSTVIMVSELTGNYELLMPTMWACAFAFLVGKRWSIFQSQVPARLWSRAHSNELSDQVFAHTTVQQVFRATRKFVSLPATASLREILDATEHSRQRVFPVVDHKGLVGCFRIDDLTHAIHEHPNDSATVTARDLIHGRPLCVRMSSEVERAQRMLRSNHVEELLVVDDANHRKVVGILTGADILLAYTRRISKLRFRNGKKAKHNGTTDAVTDATPSEPPILSLSEPPSEAPSIPPGEMPSIPPSEPPSEPPRVPFSKPPDSASP